MSAYDPITDEPLMHLGKGYGDALVPEVDGDEWDLLEPEGPRYPSPRTARRDG